MSLQALREKYPEYSDLSDKELADGFYNNHYSDMDRGEYDRRMGYQPEAAPVIDLPDERIADPVPEPPRVEIPDQKIASAPTVPSPVPVPAEPEQPGLYDRLASALYESTGKPLQRGWNRAEQALDIATGDIEGIAENTKDLNALGQSEDLYQLQRKLGPHAGLLETAAGFATSPGALWDLTMESLAPSLGGVAASAIGRAGGGLITGSPIGAALGGAAGAGAAEGATEYYLVIAEEMAESGYDMTDPRSIRLAFSDRSFMEKAKERALKRGIGIGLFGMFSAGIAGNLADPVTRVASKVDDVADASTLGKLAGGSAEIAVQGASGSAGEATAQALAGDEYDPFSIVAEGFGEVVPGAVESGIGYASNKVDWEKNQLKVSDLFPESAPESAPESSVPSDQQMVPVGQPGDDDFLLEGPDTGVVTPDVNGDNGPSGPPPPMGSAPFQSEGQNEPPVSPSGEQAVQPISGVPATVSGSDRSKVSTAKGREVDTQWRIVEASSLTTSDQEDYDPALQPRDRGNRAASTAQINDIQNNLDPARLGASPEADRGAPIVGPDGMVESGNGRVAAIRGAYEADGADGYRTWLSETTEQEVDDFDQPVLVRVRDTEMTPEDRQAFAIEANESATGSFSATEQANTDAARIDTATLSLLQPEDITGVNNREFIGRFLQNMNPAERAEFMQDDGTLSAPGVNRIQAAVLAVAYGDKDNRTSNATLSRMLESTDNNVKSITGAMLDVAPQFAQIREDTAAGRVDAEWDISAKLVEAVETVSQIRSNGRSVQEFIDQDGLFGDKDPIVDELIRAFYNDDLSRAAGRKSIADALKFYAEAAISSGQAIDMFNETGDPKGVLSEGRQRAQGQEIQEKPEAQDNTGGAESPAPDAGVNGEVSPTEQRPGDGEESGGPVAATGQRLPVEGTPASDTEGRTETETEVDPVKQLEEFHEGFEEKTATIDGREYEARHVIEDRGTFQRYFVDGQPIENFGDHINELAIELKSPNLDVHYAEENHEKKIPKDKQAEVEAVAKDFATARLAELRKDPRHTWTIADLAKNAQEALDHPSISDWLYQAGSMLDLNVLDAGNYMNKVNGRPVQSYYTGTALYVPTEDGTYYKLAGKPLLRMYAGWAETQPVTTETETEAEADPVEQSELPSDLPVKKVLDQLVKKATQDREKTDGKTGSSPVVEYLGSDIQAESSVTEKGAKRTRFLLDGKAISRKKLEEYLDEVRGQEPESVEGEAEGTSKNPADKEEGESSGQEQELPASIENPEAHRQARANLKEANKEAEKLRGTLIEERLAEVLWNFEYSLDGLEYGWIEVSIDRSDAAYLFEYYGDAEGFYEKMNDFLLEIPEYVAREEGRDHDETYWKRFGPRDDNNKFEFQEQPKGTMYEEFQDENIPVEYRKTTNWEVELFSNDQVTLTMHKRNKVDVVSYDEATEIVEGWKSHAKNQILDESGIDGELNKKKSVIFLFEESGVAREPWIEAGFTVYAWDAKNGVDISDIDVDVLYGKLENEDHVYGVFAFPPCTVLSSSSNARSFPAADADGRTEAAKQLVFDTLDIIEKTRPAVWFIENPRGSRIGQSMGPTPRNPDQEAWSVTGLGKPALNYSHYHYGDDFNKPTSLWGNFRTDLPTANLGGSDKGTANTPGGKNRKAKQARSKFPEGFSYAFFMANNYLDATDAQNLHWHFPQSTGAIDAALAAGVPARDIYEAAIGMAGRWDDGANASSDIYDLVVDRQSNSDQDTDQQDTDNDDADLTDNLPSSLNDSAVGAKTGKEPTGPESGRGASGGSDGVKRVARRKIKARKKKRDKNKIPDLAPKRKKVTSSPYESMFWHLSNGDDREVALLATMSIEEQLKKAKMMVANRYGFKSVHIGAKANPREAMDALLDAYENLRNMAAIVGMRDTAVGFEGNLILSLVNTLGNKDTRGMFQWNYRSGFESSTLSLARRADSFAHEWGHALDLYLQMYNAMVRQPDGSYKFNVKALTHRGGSENPAHNIGATGQSRQGLTPRREVGYKIDEAVRNITRALFFNKDPEPYLELKGRARNLTSQLEADNKEVKKVSKKLETRIGWRDQENEKITRAEGLLRSALDKLGRQRRGSKNYENTVSAIDTHTSNIEKWKKTRDEYQAEVDTLRARKSLLEKRIADSDQEKKTLNKDAKELLADMISEFAQSSNYADVLTSGEQGTYFGIPTELFARAFESYIGRKIGQAQGSEFMSGSEDYYDNNSDQLMQLIYPSEVDRNRIDQAFDDLFVALGDHRVFGTPQQRDVKLPAPFSRLDAEINEAVNDRSSESGMKKAWNATMNDLSGLRRLYNKRTQIKELAADARQVASVKYLNEWVSGTTLSTARGTLLGLIAKYEGNRPLQAELRKVLRKIATDPGAGGDQPRTLEEDIDITFKQQMNKLGNIFRGYKIDVDNDEQMADLREILTRPYESQVVEARKMLDEAEMILDEIKENLPEKPTKKDVKNLAAAKAHLANSRRRHGVLSASLEDFENRVKTGDNNVAKAGQAIRKLMDDQYNAANDAHIGMGYVMTQGYLPRILDSEKVENDREGFLAAATIVYEDQRRSETFKLRTQIRENEGNDAKVDELKQELAQWSARDPRQMAEEWLYEQTVSEFFAAEKSGPPQTFAKARTLPASAEILLADYYITDVDVAIHGYLQSTSRRIAWAKRFGPKNDILFDHQDELYSRGIKDDDLKLVNRAVKIAAGAYKPVVAEEGNTANWMFHLGNAAMLVNTLFVSIPEPIVAGFRSGDVKDSVRAMGETMKDLLNATDSARARREMAEFIGLTGDIISDNIMHNKMMMNGSDSQQMQAFMSNIFRAIGVFGYTQASRRGVSTIAHKALRTEAGRLLNGSDREKVSAKDALGELGILAKDQEKFAEWVLKLVDSPRKGQLENPDEAPLVDYYITAMNRFVDQSIQNPRAVDRPAIAFSPLGRLLTSLMSFSSTFQRNVIIAQGKKAITGTKKLKAGEAKWDESAAYTMNIMSVVALLIAGQMAMRLARDVWKDPFGEDEDGNTRAQRTINRWTDDPFRALLDGLSVAGFFGMTDPVYQAESSFKYNRSLHETAIGAVPSYYLGHLQDIMKGITDDSDTNTAEWKAWKAGYQLTAGIGLPFVTNAAAATGPLAWITLSKGSGPQAAEAFATFMAGDKGAPDDESPYDEYLRQREEAAEKRANQRKRPERPERPEREERK